MVIEYVEYLCLDYQKMWMSLINKKEEFFERSLLMNRILGSIIIQKVSRTKKEWQESYGYEEDEIDEYNVQTSEIIFIFEEEKYIFKRMDYYHSWYWDSYHWVSYSLQDSFHKNKKVVIWKKNIKEECYRYFSELIQLHELLAQDEEQQWEWKIDKSEKTKVYGKRKKRKKSYKKIK